MAIPFVDWPEFEKTFRWSQGEHLTAMAPTGGGKTTLFKKLMPYRAANIMFGTKVEDDLYNQILKTGFKRIERMSEMVPWHHNYILWPKFKKTIPEFVNRQQNTFREALDVVVSQQRWTVWVDEAKYFAQYLKLDKELTFSLEQLRSIKATVICGAQRPAWLTPSALSSSTHVFIAKTTDRNDQIKLADVGGIDAKLVRDVAKTLGPFEFLYIKTRGTESHIVRTKVKE